MYKIRFTPNIFPTGFRTAPTTRPFYPTRRSHHTSHACCNKHIANTSRSSRVLTLLEHFVHHRLALLVAHEASSVSEEGTNDARRESREEGLHASLRVETLRAIHKSAVLPLRLHDAVHLQLGLHDIDGIDSSPVRDASDASSHELREHALVLHVAQRLSLLEQSAAIPLVHAEIQRDGDRVTQERRAEALVAAEDPVHLDDLLDGAAHRGELRLVLRVVFRANDLHLQLRFEQIHRGFHEGDRHAGEGSGQKGLRKSKDLAMADDLLHLTVREELHGVEDHVSYR